MDGGVQPRPSAGDTALFAVAATSATDAWAVGQTHPGSSAGNLIEHWNGSNWSVVPGPAGAGLFSVAATSAANAWAAGNDSQGNLQILHWNGTAWTATPSPTPGMLAGSVPRITATSATSAWLAGYTFAGANAIPVTEHWDGTSWTVIPSVNPNGSTEPEGVAATSAGDAWIVGATLPSAQRLTFTEHWNGTAWTAMSSPSPTGQPGSELESVADTSPNDAWAVGVTWLNNGRNGFATLIEHWNGSAWTVTPSP